MNKLPEINELHGYTPVSNVLVIGCGGTGAYLVAHLSRFISVLNKDKRNIKLFLADGDVVEQKNLARQHFVSSDISKNKASVLAERYSNAFGIEINVIPHDIAKMEEIENLFPREYNNSDLVVGCVDNNASRKVINEWFTYSSYYKTATRFWVDCGNEEKSGQVVIGCSPSINTGKQVKATGHKKGMFSLPSVMEIYPELLTSEGVFNSGLSCADRAISAPQNIQTNITAATLALNFIQKVLLGEGLKSHGVEFSIDNAFSTKLNTPENLSVVNDNRKQYWEK
jgi:PRTRC genetic system ThiF family protein